MLSEYLEHLIRTAPARKTVIALVLLQTLSIWFLVSLWPTIILSVTLAYFGLSLVKRGDYGAVRFFMLVAIVTRIIDLASRAFS
jgi:hypothetical protein